jgi:hypothetical protein
MAKEHNRQKAELTEAKKRRRLRRVYKLLAELAEEEESAGLNPRAERAKPLRGCG